MPVGKKLAAERRSQSKTLAEVVDATKIMGRILESLENERWDELPAPSYVKGFIQNYAQVLGLDPKPLVEEYQNDIAMAPAAQSRTPLRQLPERQVVPHRRDIHAIPATAIVAIVGVLAVVILALWGISSLVGQDDTPPPIAPEVTTSTTTVPGITSTEPSTSVPSGTTQTEDIEGAFDLTVVVAPGDTSWVRVVIDGLVAYEGTLPGGEQKVWTV
ncbi:MAG: helix-turn-helix domain-containing protein, partial [Coriobacteriia bacterium]|nr:helix-turn-helix domain-containing protein [Coriobacteriia bacterium]